LCAAHALWRFVPLYADEDCVRLGFPVVPRGPRIRLFCGAYGLERPEGILETVRARQLALYEAARQCGAARAGPGWADVWRDTRGEQWLRVPAGAPWNDVVPVRDPHLDVCVGIHECPIDEGTLARVITITTSVIAAATARLILTPLGF